MKYRFEAITSQYIHKINAEKYTDIALALFHFQYANNEIYKQFTDALHVNTREVKQLTDIPFLPISFFKTHKVITKKNGTPALIFESSGTTGEIPSRHYVFNAALYEASLLRGFNAFYGDVKNYAILALLPSYLERKNASLVHMAEVLMKKSRHPANGFYLDEWEKLNETMQTLEAQRQPIILLGVTFALLDFAANFPMEMKHTIIMETGGMKGRKKEWTRTQVHDFLKTQWHLKQVHSEYGMTELLSQAYAKKDGRFMCSDTMRVLVRDINDPLDIRENGNGCFNIIDLANVDSCAFIASDDLGKVEEDGSFEVLGRIDHSALRGCSLMAV